MSHEERLKVPREFDCRYCGDHVEVTEETDKRYVYCCQKCEKEYWRKRSKDQLHKRLDRGHITYLSRERSENRREAGF